MIDCLIFICIAVNILASSTKNLVAGVILTLGSRASGIITQLIPKPWLTEPSEDDPSKWKHEPENNRALATFGAGCYWGTEKFFCTEFA